MSCCAGSVQYRSSPGNTSLILQIARLPLDNMELDSTDQESICPEGSRSPNKVGIDGLSDVLKYRNATKNLENLTTTTPTRGAGPPYSQHIVAPTGATRVTPNF
ncbi:unnamed protein product, partial [Laminaria digitata]